jgi:hypothetical protein
LKRLEAMERRRDRLESRRSSPEGGWWVAAVVASSLLFLLGVTALIVWLIVSLAG